MTPDPFTAVLNQLAEHTEQIIRLDTREADHFTVITGRLTELTDLITGIGQTLQHDTPALTRLEALDRQVTDLAAQLTGTDAHPGDYHPEPAPPWWKLPADQRQEPVVRLRAWVEQVYRPGYGHLAATLGPCWASHDLCLYGLDILSGLVVGPVPAASHHHAAVRPGRIPGPHPARPGRPADDRDLQLRPPPRPCPPARPLVERAMTDAILRQALAYARRGWPVFPCLPGQKIPATRHGFRDATTDEQQITDWFGRGARWNLAIATGAPGPDVLDIDQHGPAGNGYAAFTRLRRAGLADGAAAYVRTPAGGMHAYFTGSDQHNGRLPSHHLDFRSAGGYIVAPPSQVDGKPYQLIKRLRGRGGLDWNKVTRLLEPQQQPHRPQPRPAPGLDLNHLARWVASQPEGNRNAGLFWAANRALDADHAADLSPLAVAARQAGLGDKEITRTLDSARRTGPEPCPSA